MWSPLEWMLAKQYLTWYYNCVLNCLSVHFPTWFLISLRLYPPFQCSQVAWLFCRERIYSPYPPIELQTFLRIHIQNWVLEHSQHLVVHNHHSFSLQIFPLLDWCCLATTAAEGSVSIQYSVIRANASPSILFFSFWFVELNQNNQKYDVQGDINICPKDINYRN